MKSYFSRFLYYTLSYSGGKPDTASALSYSDLIGVSRSNQVANLSNLDYRVKPDNDSEGADHLVKFENDSVCSGRSMVEMLGVLAIIGVLSVGAIAGYSKAMNKYKLNKQTEQISSILDYVNIHMGEFKRSKTSISANMIPILTKLNIIPKEMIRENSVYAVYDAFNTAMYIQNYTIGDGDYHFEFLFYLNKGKKDACMNLFNIAKAQRGQLWRTKFQTVKGEAAGVANSVWGDAYCESDRKCLKDLTVAEMENYCTVCEDKDSCILYYQIKL